MKHPIPAAALTQHIAVLGKNGSGKSYAVRGVVESLLDEGARVCVIDPTGVWYGLRTLADGKRAGYPVAIFGGPNADFPLQQHHGEELAEIIGTSNTPAILDVSLLRTGERTRLFTDFAEGLMRKNRGPLHLIIDEAHLFAPQGRVNDPQSGAMLHAANNLVSLGRSRGLRVTLISQRPAKVHKDSLTQVETLIAMRLIAPQDRKAVEEWIKDNTDATQAKDILSSLATLKTGHGWVWAPEMGILERVAFPRIRTLDTGRTPDGSEVAGKVLAPIDRDAITARLKVVAQEAEANDPKKLKARIAELERQAKQTPAAPVIDKAALDAAREDGYRQGVLTLHAYAEKVEAWLERFPRADNQPLPAVVRPSIPAPPRAPPRTIVPSSSDESPSVRKILDVFHRSYPVSLSFHPAARRAAISSRSSAYRKYRAAVEGSAELEPADGKYRSRPEFASSAPINSAATIQEWVSKLPPAYGKMLTAIHERGPIDKESVADLAGVSRTSSGLGSGLRELQSLSLVTEDRGMYSLADGLSD